MSRTAPLFVIALGLCALPPSRVRAEGPVALEISVPQCLTTIEAELRAILVIELDTIARIDDQTRDATMRVLLACRSSTVLIRVLRLDTGEVLEDRVDGPSATTLPTARTVALVLTELVAAMRPVETLVEPDAPPGDSPPPDETEGEPTPVIPEPTRSTTPWRVDGAFVLRFPSGDGPWMGGLRAGAVYHLRNILRLSSGLEWLSGARGTELGRIRATSFTADVATGIGYPRRNHWAGFDAGLRLGAMFWRGSAEEGVAGSRDAKLSLGFFGRIVGEVGISERLRLRGALELGAVLVGSDAAAVDDSSGTPVVVDRVAADRFWCTLMLGASLAL